VIHDVDTPWAACGFPCCIETIFISGIDACSAIVASFSGLPSHDTYTSPFGATCSAWKLCDPNTAPSVTVIGELQLFPLSVEVTMRNAESGNRSSGTSFPTVYTA